jgi:hypothetical protein
MVRVPGVPSGRYVPNLPDDVKDLYDEARQCMTVSAYTYVVLACRKLLMHVGMSRGATPNQRFVDYVDYLEDNHYMPPDARAWVDKIRGKGNNANHEISMRIGIGCTATISSATASPPSTS